MLRKGEKAVEADRRRRKGPGARIGKQEEENKKREWREKRCAKLCKVNETKDAIDNKASFEAHHARMQPPGSPSNAAAQRSPGLWDVTRNASFVEAVHELKAVATPAP